MTVWGTKKDPFVHLHQTLFLHLHSASPHTLGPESLIKQKAIATRIFPGPSIKGLRASLSTEQSLLLWCLPTAARWRDGRTRMERRESRPGLGLDTRSRWPLHLLALPPQGHPERCGEPGVPGVSGCLRPPLPHAGSLPIAGDRQLGKAKAQGPAGEAEGFDDGPSSEPVES